MKEIGSDMNIPFRLLFGKNISEQKKGVCLSTGRDCLEYIISGLHLKKGDVVLLPAYLCPEMLRPFEAHELHVRFYKITEKLEISSQDFRGELEKGDVKLVLMINYFGFPDPGRYELERLCQKQGVVLVEDCAQSFLSDLTPVGDIHFISYRKSMPLPDGAIVWGKSFPLEGIKTQKTAFAKTRYSAGLLKNFKWLKFIWRPMFIKAETELANNYERPAVMSSASQEMFKKLDLKKAKMQRWYNYIALARGLKYAPYIELIYPLSLPREVIPLFFPILCRCELERDDLRERLRQNKIYCPIHWQMPTILSKDLFPVSYDLSSRILSLPIDQRYNEDDMERIVKVIYGEKYDNPL